MPQENRHCRLWLFRFALLLCAALPSLAPQPAAAAEIHPFNTFDQSPLVQIYGLPAPESARVLPPQGVEARLALDAASNFAVDTTSREAIILDGESWRTTLSLRRGFAAGVEAGIEVPFVSQSPGVTDDFIQGWHDVFQLPQGGRDKAPRGRLNYLYLRDGEERLRYDRSQAGIGDLRLSAAYQLLQEDTLAVTLRAALKLPTGNADRLLGSGSTDLSLWCTAQKDFFKHRFGTSALFGSAGALAKTRGDVLADQQRYLVGFASVGAGWSPARLLAFKLQLSGHSPFYRGSDLQELNAFSMLLVLGGTLAFSERTELDIGVSEDVLVKRSPDVAFHLALSRRF